MFKGNQHATRHVYHDSSQLLRNRIESHFETKQLTSIKKSSLGTDRNPTSTPWPRSELARSNMPECDRHKPNEQI